MQCTEVLEERLRPPGRLSPITLLCQRVGCKCLVDGHVYCSLDRAESFPVYAEFASRCEQPEWCTCHYSGQSARLQTTNSEACLQAIQSAWSLPPAPSRKDIPRTIYCCDSSQFIAHLPDKLILLYGLQRILGSAAALVPGICIIYQNNSPRELTFRTNRMSHLHPTKRAVSQLHTYLPASSTNHDPVPRTAM